MIGEQNIVEVNLPGLRTSVRREVSVRVVYGVEGKAGEIHRQKV